ncbi:MAG: adenylate cyclase, partial [Acidimicrobiaceae bacterium]
MPEVRIEIRQPDRAPLHIVVVGRIELGRDCDGVLLFDERVSRRHVQLVVTDLGLEVTDLGSTNGSFVNGQRVGGPTMLGPDDRLVVGDTVVVLRAEARSDTGPSSARQTTAGSVPLIGVGRTTSEDVVRPVAPIQGAHRTSIDIVASEVQRSGVGALQPHVDGTVTIVFSDIENSTVMAERLGDSRWLDLLHDHNELVRLLLGDHSGKEIKAQGDGFMLTFPSARRGIGFSIALQRALRLYNARHPELVLRVRVGVHTGDAIHDKGDIFGKHVILAARIASIAEGAQILVSSLAYELASSSGGVPFGAERKV